MTVTDLTEEQQNRFVDYIEWWNTATYEFQDEPVEEIDKLTVHAAVRVTFIGFYDPDEDDFDGETYFSRSILESETPVAFHKKDKQYCGFLYLRSIRTGTRALSLEHGSLLVEQPPFRPDIARK